ncbi:MAG: type II toxin-antitoxin system VapC family toxin, partial [Methanobacteriota archaeon]
MIVLDSDILVDVLRQRDPAFEFVARLQAAGEIIGTTSVNVAELFRGLPPRSRAAELAAATVAALQEVPVGPRVARRYGSLLHALDRAGTPIPAGDGLVAAAARASG